ncbi:MAG: type II toxin-antitoxin system HicB family antitoxin [Oscillospiraceae bacterium]|nr:type II toxin-antitoxin system HicB family antitoxin [Oscillospiraceae bacterium]
MAMRTAKTMEKDYSIESPKVIHVAIFPSEDVGGYWAKSITMPGAFTQGDTIQETEKNMYEAVDLLIEDDYPEITEYTLEFEVRNA